MWPLPSRDGALARHRGMSDLHETEQAVRDALRTYDDRPVDLTALREGVDRRRLRLVRLRRAVRLLGRG